MLQVGEFVITKKNVDTSYSDYHKGIIYKVHKIEGTDVTLNDPITGLSGLYINKLHLQKITKAMIATALERKISTLTADIAVAAKAKEFLDDNVSKEIIEEIQSFVEIEEASCSDDIMKLVSMTFNAEKLLSILHSLHHCQLDFE